MGITHLKTRRKVFFVFFWTVLIAAGCGYARQETLPIVSPPIFIASQTPTIVAPNPNPTNTPVGSQATPTESKPGFDPALSIQESCDWPALKISPAITRQIFWSPDSQHLYFLLEDTKEWMDYAVKSGVTDRLIDLPDIITGNPFIISDWAAAEKFEVKDAQYAFVSPDGKSVIFLRFQNDRYQVFYKDLMSSQEVFLGEISGSIENRFWINGGKELLLVIGWRLPLGVVDAYVYRIRLDEGDILVEIPNRPDLRNLSVLDVSPDDQWILYDLIIKDSYLWLWNLNTSDIRQTSVRGIVDMVWLTEDTFLAVGSVDEKNNSYIFTYSLSKDNIFVRLKHALSLAKYFDSVKISPDGRYVAWVWANNSILYLTPCHIEKD